MSKIQISARIQNRLCYNAVTGEYSRYLPIKYDNKTVGSLCINDKGLTVFFTNREPLYIGKLRKFDSDLIQKLTNSYKNKS